MAGPEFAHRVFDRLHAGAVEYGDGSFRRPTSELLDELEEEALDLAGWGFVLYTRAVGIDFGDTLRDARSYLLRASLPGAQVWPPPSDLGARSTAIWLASLSRAVMAHLERVRAAQ